MRKTLEAQGKTLEAQGDPFRRGLPTLQTSLTLPELPHKTPPFREQKFVLLFTEAGFCGEVFSIWEVEIWSRVRLSRTV